MKINKWKIKNIRDRDGSIKDTERIGRIVELTEFPKIGNHMIALFCDDESNNGFMTTLIVYVVNIGDEYYRVVTLNSIYELEKY